MFSESAADSGSKEVKDRRSTTTSTVYTVDTSSEKPSSNGGLAAKYCDSQQSPLSTLKNTGQRKNVAAAAAAWRHCSTVIQSEIYDQSSPLHRPTDNDQCLRRSETSSPAEVG